MRSFLVKFLLISLSIYAAGVLLPTGAKMLQVINVAIPLWLGAILTTVSIALLILLIEVALEGKGSHASK